MKTETRDLNGHPFFIRSWGDPARPPLLLLHGFPEYGGAWADLVPYLTDHFHCIAPDQRGYGQSWTPPDVSDYATSNLVSDMAALISQIGAPLTVLGHDWGASVAYALAISQPQLVSRLIILNGVHPVPFQREIAKGGAQTAASQYIHGLRRPSSHDHLAADNCARLLAILSTDMDMSWMTHEKQAAYLAEWSRPGRLKAMIHWYRASPLKVATPGTPLPDPPAYPADQMQIRCPHLLIWGEGDTALLPASTQGLEEFAPDLTRVTIADADHWLHHQRPQEVAQAIHTWLPDNSVSVLT